MPKPQLTRADLMPLERYHAERRQFRQQVLAHKAARQVALGGHVNLVFEDALTIQYQIQEMLRVERIFESEGIQAELDAYTPLIPDGTNWKATMMIEYEDVEERRVALMQLVGIEDRVWTRVGDGPTLFAIADEDLDRSRADKTAAVHFLRFQLPPAQVAAAKSGDVIAFGIDHQAYQVTLEILSNATRSSLVGDLA